MKRTVLPLLLGLASTALVGCVNVVYLAPQEYAALPDTAAVGIIDATDMTRGQLESVFNEHEILARFSAFVSDGENRAADLAKELEKGKATARLLGGDVLMHTTNSELVAVIARDGNYAGPGDEIVIL